MFGARFFGARFYGPRYFGEAGGAGGATAVPVFLYHLRQQRMA